MNEITFDYFKTWLKDLVKNKNGTLPDTSDWKQIKVMLDRVKVPRQSTSSENHTSMDMDLYIEHVTSAPFIEDPSTKSNVEVSCLDNIPTPKCLKSLI